MMDIKICGITNLKDAKLAVNVGANAIGFIFYKSSPRYIDPLQASKIAANLQGKISLVGVFVDEIVNKIHEVSKLVGLDFIQLHGNESPEFCKKVKLPIIKAFRISNIFDQRIMDDYNVHAFLFDAYKKDLYGGSGKIFNWELLRKLDTDNLIILSGGLHKKNILSGIKVISPDAVDVNSGVESRPGIKDKEKMKVLFEVLKNIESSSSPFRVPIGQEDSDEL